MKRIVALIWWLTACVLAGLASGAEASLQGAGGDNGPPDCFDDVTVQIKLTPLQILLGQSSRLTWSIDVPQPCPVHFQLNGNTMPEKLSELQLRKIDGDAICDVAPKTSSPVITPDRYSKSGTGPWVPFSVNTQ